MLENTSITSYAVNPGVCESNLWRNVWPYSWRLTWLCLSPWVYLFCRTPNYGAETTYYCALDRELSTESGKYYKNCKEVGEKFYEFIRNFGCFVLEPIMNTTIFVFNILLFFVGQWESNFYSVHWSESCSKFLLFSLLYLFFVENLKLVWKRM